MTAPSRNVHRVDRPPARLFLLVVLVAAGCAKGPLRSGHGPLADGDGDGGTSEPPGGEAGDAARPDPEASDRCDPVALLAYVPRDVPGWNLDPAPIYPYEHYAGVPLGFVGRLFRGERRCAIVAAGRPADVAAVFQAMAEERATFGKVHGRDTATRRAPEANQVTTLVRDGTDRVYLVRMFGSTDPETLAPFLEALLPESADGADVGPDDDDADVPPPCPASNPFGHPYDPAAFYGPPGDCWL